MKKMRPVCCDCAGLGYKTVLKIIGDGLAQGEEIKCESCDGKGWTEHAVFSPEEAEVILKLCGLDKE